MPKFKVTTSFIQHGIYIVEAKDKDEAEEKAVNGDFISFKDAPETVEDSQEEVIDVE